MSAGELKLALDLGTTTLAGRLLGPTGGVLAEAEGGNPQAEVGADVIRRMEAALGGEGGRLQSLLVAGVNALVTELLSLAGTSRSAIGAAAAAGNPAVTYLLRGLSPKEILFPPHRPRNGRGEQVDLTGAGLDLPVPLYLFPLVSGYVGGDLVAFLYALEPALEGTFFLDLGTNGEMAFWSGDSWWTTSVAAGPAFEGGGIACGMAARRGAVAAVAVSGDSLRLEVLGGGPPRGICGSGVASAIAAALDGGLLDSRGTIADPDAVTTNLSRYLVQTSAGRALRLYRDAAVDLLLTQEDIRRFQLAKGAVRAGAECLLQRAGNPAVRQVVVTGAFGFSLPRAVLKRVAMLPPNMVDRVVFTPGGALAGASRLLMDPDAPVHVQSLAASLRPYPLSGTPAFEKAFLNGIDF